MPSSKLTTSQKPQNHQTRRESESESETSKNQFFAKVVNVFYAGNYFCKKPRPRCLQGF